jgi:tRNA pseudouridine65 synthase
LESVEEAKTFGHTLAVMTELSSHLGRGVRELWRDDLLWVLDKPAGTLSHPNPPATSAANALIHADYDFERELYRIRDGHKTMRIWLAHRLDRETSGIILCAFTEEAAAALKAALQQREVKKEYRALVLGIPREPSGDWRDHLERNRRDGRVEVEVVRRSPANATTHFEVATPWPKPGVALISLTPREGRTHQLRVQCARHGHPIAGDDRYGDFGANRHLAKHAGLKRMFLVAHRLRLTHPGTGKQMSFAAELRPELAKVLDAVAAATVSVPRTAPHRQRRRPRSPS